MVEQGYRSAIGELRVSVNRLHLFGCSLTHSFEDFTVMLRFDDLAQQDGYHTETMICKSRGPGNAVSELRTSRPWEPCAVARSNVLTAPKLPPVFYVRIAQRQWAGDDDGAIENMQVLTMPLYVLRVVGAQSGTVKHTSTAKVTSLTD